MITPETIEQIALANGFKLKEQPDGSMALNPYVFEFARALLASRQPEIDALKRDVGGLISNLNSEHDERISLEAEVERLCGLYESAVKGQNAFREGYKVWRAAAKASPGPCPICSGNKP